MKQPFKHAAGRSDKPANPPGDKLTGQFLVAMPQMPDERFARTVIYICAHSGEGAMGLVVNRLFQGVAFPDLLAQLHVEVEKPRGSLRVHYGGPVETGRGFVLHSADYLREGSMAVTQEVVLTATVDILRAVAEGAGPQKGFLALGYAGWGPGQLDQEMQANGWLNVPADAALLFDPDLDHKWERSLARLGIDLSMLSADIGHA
ncbi:YqgE/AlgH family protein [Niveispirillum sp. SYP-B3756]|uniref:YqgE/AlgH family protein n=1 Tax=Niveispirillum sp. SYP-B3756 TaxID=2662178 RepID=UPI00129137B8|nr:YqgE/AlgH family protein [Niveispirillum sp. SYP-B3756]MQP67108.1 YqgE/AlgH family protein [Niveispirillum sp. SYP-B3756]